MDKIEDPVEAEFKASVLETMKEIGDVLEGRKRNMVATCIALVEIAAQVAGQGRIPENIFRDMLHSSHKRFKTCLEEEIASTKH